MYSKIKKALAKKIIKIAEKRVENSIVKSFPLGIHELKVPEEILKKYRKED